jgi:hypothetical protein
MKESEKLWRGWLIEVGLSDYHIALLSCARTISVGSNLGRPIADLAYLRAEDWVPRFPQAISDVQDPAII